MQTTEIHKNTEYTAPKFNLKRDLSHITHTKQIKPDDHIKEATLWLAKLQQLLQDN